jgi:xylulokinase
MSVLLGIDLGTSSVKALVLDSESGAALGVESCPYPMYTPAPAYAEQDPEDWWEAAVGAVRGALETAGPVEVAGIGLSGQMHGTILMGEKGLPLASAIIWADSRSADDAAALASLDFNDTLPGPPAAGFMASSLRWLSRERPDLIRDAACILLPKDVLRARLTGGQGTDFTDAAGSWLFDIRRGAWSEEVLAACGVSPTLMPPIHFPAEVVGRLRPEAAAALGLPAGIPLVAGCADQPAQALGHGLSVPGETLITIGTGGQVFKVIDSPTPDPAGRYHVFNHVVPGRWYALAATLAAGLSLRWLKELLGGESYESLSALAAEIPAGAAGLTFLPYLNGERSPLMDPSARGAFVGLRLDHGRGHLARAVMEGVAYSLAACLDALGMDSAGAIRFSGGGARSAIWPSIMAGVLNRPLALADGDTPHAPLGAARLAGIGTGVYRSYPDALARGDTPAHVVEPDPAWVEVYREGRARYEALYPALRARE